MPAGPSQQIDRQVYSQLNSGTGDALPGQSVASGTGAAQYLGIVGGRLWLDSQTIRYNSSVGTLYGGVYQYVFMTYTTQQPLIGQLVFWDNSVAESTYQVNGDAKPATTVPTLVAGVVIQASVVKNTYGWMQISGRATVLFDSSVTSTTAGYPVSAKISASNPSTADCGAMASTYAQANANVVLAAKIGIAEATVTAGASSLVQLDPLIRHL